jgi:hypothetical protein
MEFVDPIMVEVLRSKTERERLEIAFGMWRSAHAVLRSLLTAEHPNWSRDAIECETARRLALGAH